MADEKFFEEEADILAPIIHNLLAMRRAARDAFNRHSRDKLQDLQNLQGTVAQNITQASREIKSLMARKPEVEKQELLRLETILGRLGEIKANLGNLADPIHKKIQGRGSLFRQGRGPKQLSF